MMKRALMLMLTLMLMEITGSAFRQNGFCWDSPPPFNGEDRNQIIREQGTEVGTNTFYGEGAGRITTGYDNTFIGYKSGYTNGNGSTNTFIGSQAGVVNTTGSGNVFIGHEAGWRNADADHNIFIGLCAGQQNQSEDNNIFIGTQAGNNNQTGNQNTYVGHWAGAWMNGRSNNTLVGFRAGEYNVGHNNSFFGNLAGASGPYGYNYANSNTFMGNEAGKGITEGDCNTFIGAEAGKMITEGSYNTFVGEGSGESNTEGSNNVFMGYEAGKSNKGGAKNTAIGYWAGYANTSGERNVFLGYYAGALELGSNKLYIDNSGVTTPLIWGDFETNNVVIYGGFRAIASYSSSDARLKRNIQPLDSSLAKISGLQGVSYEWKKDEYPDMGLTEGKQIGLVAQDVEKVLPELVSEDKDGYKAVSYTKLTAVLIEAVKELKAQNEKQQAEIEALRALIK